MVKVHTDLLKTVKILSKARLKQKQNVKNNPQQQRVNTKKQNLLGRLCILKWMHFTKIKRRKKKKGISVLNMKT